MRVAHVVRSLEIGGLERLVFDLAVGSNRFESAVYCLTQLGPFGEMLQARGIPVTVVGMDGGPLRTIRRLWGHFRECPPSVVHCHNLQSHLYGSLSGRACGVRAIVFSKHGTHFPLESTGGWLNSRLLRYSHTVAVSEDILSLCLRRLRLHKRNVHYIPNGLSLHPYQNLPSRAEARRQLGWPANDFRVGVVARLAAGKGHSVLLHAFQAFLPTAPQAKLVIIGDGPERPSIQQTIEELGLGGSVVFTGVQKEIPRYLAALDLFTLPSFDEGIPMTILEAMAAGLPVLATVVGGIPQVVVNGKTGILVPARSADRLAEALTKLYLNPDLAASMGKEGRIRVQDEFDAQVMVNRYEKLYSKLLENSEAVERHAT